MAYPDRVDTAVAVHLARIGEKTENFERVKLEYIYRIEYIKTAQQRDQRHTNTERISGVVGQNSRSLLRNGT